MERRLDSLIRSPGSWTPILVALMLLAFPVRAHDVHEHDDDHTSEPAGHPESDTPRSLLQAFRAGGDDSHLDRAWSLVEPQLHAGTSTPSLLIDAALVAQARHRFDEALGLTRAALEIDAHDDQAWMLLASIYLVTGEVEQAGAACDALRRSPLLVIVGCAARVAHATGAAARARPGFERLLAVTDTAHADAATFAWALSVAGDLAVATDDPEQAIAYFNRSLALTENAQVRSALVDVLLATGRLADAEVALNGAYGALPLDVRRLILAKRQGRITDDAERIAAVDRRFREWIAVEDWLHAREMARFYLDVVDCPALARQLASINIAIQQEPEDQRLVRRTERRSREPTGSKQP